MLSVIVPMRNEEENAGEFLKTLKRSLDEVKEDYEVIVVNDGSSDKTEEIVGSFGFVRLITLERKPDYIIGKNYALWMGYKESSGDILLFLDADVRVDRYSIKRILPLLQRFDMVSMSPKQIVGSPFEASLQPFIFKFLSKIYPLERIKDPRSSIAAANGQFIMIKRDVYGKVCGHKVLYRCILEDVELAKNVKFSGYRIFLGNGKEFGIRCRMYRRFSDMIEGWTKNLYLLSHKRFYLLLTFGFMHLFEALAILFLTIYFAYIKDYGMASGVFLLGNLYTLWYFRNHYEFYTVFHMLFGSLLFLLISFKSYWSIKFRKSVVWKDRVIHLS